VLILSKPNQMLAIRPSLFDSAQIFKYQTHILLAALAANDLCLGVDHVTPFCTISSSR
jgi:hypothetical protein